MNWNWPFIRQKLIGAALLLLCVPVFALASDAPDGDITATLIYAPVGLALLLSRQQWM